MNLKLVIRQPWDLGYKIKRVVNDADFEFTLSQAGWVGETRMVLPRPDFDFILLGDEVEVRDESDAVVWAGKVVAQRFANNSNFVDLTVRGLMEYLYDLPVDAQFPDTGVNWQAGDVWQKSCVLARIHWRRVDHQSLGTVTYSLDKKLDFRGRTLGDVYRSILGAGGDIVVSPSINSDGTIKPRIASRSTTVYRISRDNFADWEVEYDARPIVNRLLTIERNDQRKNLLSDPSFEDWQGLAWEVLGSGSGGALPTGATVARRSPMTENNQLPLFSHATLLQIYIPPSSPAGWVQLQTRNQLGFTQRGISGASVNWNIRVWAYALNAGGTIQALVGSTAGSALSIAAGWNSYTWAFSFTADTQARVAFKITGTTTAAITVYLDHAEVTSSEGAVAIPPPLLVGASDDHIVADGAFRSKAGVGRVLKATNVAGNQWDFWSPQAFFIASDLVGKEAEIWDYWFIRYWKGTIDANPDASTVRVTITENPSATDPYAGTTIRVLRNPSNGKGYSSESWYGPRYGTEVMSGYQEEVSWLNVFSQPEIRFVGELVNWRSLLPADGRLDVLGIYDESSTIFPLDIVENVVSVKSGEVVAQKIVAGSRELSFRGLMRKIQKQNKEYVQARRA